MQFFSPHRYHLWPHSDPSFTLPKIAYILKSDTQIYYYKSSKVFGSYWLQWKKQAQNTHKNVHKYFLQKIHN